MLSKSKEMYHLKKKIAKRRKQNTGDVEIMLTKAEEIYGDLNAKEPESNARTAESMLQKAKKISVKVAKKWKHKTEDVETKDEQQENNIEVVEKMLIKAEEVYCNLISELAEELRIHENDVNNMLDKAKAIYDVTQLIKDGNNANGVKNQLEEVEKEYDKLEHTLIGNSNNNTKAVKYVLAKATTWHNDNLNNECVIKPVEILAKAKEIYDLQKLNTEPEVNTKDVKGMLAEAKDMYDLKHKLALGDTFANTVMMGELPLSVAALTFNNEMINILLENGSELERQNS